MYASHGVQTAVNAMKFKAGALFATLFIAVPAVHGAGSRNCTLKQFEEAAHRAYVGTQLPPRGAYGALWRLVRCQRAGTGARLEARRMWKHAHDAWALRRQASDGWDSPDIGDIPGVPRSFVMCVAGKESTWGTNPAADGNVYGITPGSGYDVEGASLAVQKHAFAALFRSSGPGAWTQFEPPPACV